MTPAPLVVTLALPDDVQARFDAERARWFPAGRTAVGAHLTLFHAVPGELQEQVVDDLREQAGQAFTVRIAGVMPLGRGAAYAVESDELTRCHRALQARWWPHLTRQDRQPLRAHITVQNKVEPAEARRTLEALAAGFTPAVVDALGFDLWRYDGGPWTHLGRASTPSPPLRS
ncbi:2'-5' RNA ligase family protein [uncultured Jatrophihabitans sp.]|uniref:2'-5' RNA ligase family protein n=1 Tax=uncultured Jatrophihabitans sp. TaxID=1610747 RepID=UPI0035CACCA9